MQLKDGTLLQGGKYEIVRFIASGGFGCTYEAKHTLLDERVAVKEFFVSDFCNRDEKTGQVTVATQSKVEIVGKLRKKFIDEARALFKMKHRGIVRVIDIFEENGTAYYAMEYIEGQSLGDMVKQRGKLPEAEAVGYIRQVAEALKYVHSLNRLHLDIKPGNIMLNKEGKAVLIDFGASKHYDVETGENTSTLLGINTKGYAPVEQVNRSFKSFSPATDIYALGATLYKLLTGITPPPSTELNAEEATLAPLPQSITASTRRAVEAAMQLLRKNRPQSVGEWLKSFGEAKEDDEATEIAVEDVHFDRKKKHDDGSRISIDDEEEDDVEDEESEEDEEEDDEDYEVNEIEDDEESEDNSHSLLDWNKIGSYVYYGGIIALVVYGLFYYVRSCTSEEEKEQDEIGAIVEAIDNAVDEEEATNDGSNALTPRWAPNVTEKQRTVLEKLIANMVKVEGGTFTMGATAEQGSDVHDDEKPAHRVTLSDYYIGKYEVTQAEWETVMGEKPTSDGDKTWTSKYGFGGNYPAYYISWNDCQEFIKKLNELTGLRFKLPTEAQWEYAARGGNRSRGYKYSGSTDSLDDVAWYWANAGEKTHSVGMKQANELGLYDMSGNVWEWCSGRKRTYSSEAQTNLMGLIKKLPTVSYRVLRGGGWYDDDVTLFRVANRNSSSVTYRFSEYGMRLAL